MRPTSTASQQPAQPVTEPAVFFTQDAMSRINLATPPSPDTSEPPHMLAVGTEEEVHVEWREAMRLGRLMVLEALVPGEQPGSVKSVGSILLNPAMLESTYTERTDVTIESEDADG